MNTKRNDVDNETERGDGHLWIDSTIAVPESARSVERPEERIAEHLLCEPRPALCRTSERRFTRPALAQKKEGAESDAVQLHELSTAEVRRTSFKSSWSRHQPEEEDVELLRERELWAHPQ